MRVWKVTIWILVSIMPVLFCGCSPFITGALTRNFDSNKYMENYWLEELQHNKSPHMRKHAAVTLGHLDSSKSGRIKGVRYIL